MNDDLLDYTGFEDLDVPTPLECWRHQAHQLACEVGELQKDLSNARKNIHTLVRMHTEATKERDALNFRWSNSHGEYPTCLESKEWRQRRRSIRSRTATDTALTDTRRRSWPRTTSTTHR